MWGRWNKQDLNHQLLNKIRTLLFFISLPCRAVFQTYSTYLKLQDHYMIFIKLMRSSWLSFPHNPLAKQGDVVKESPFFGGWGPLKNREVLLPKRRPGWHQIVSSCTVHWSGVVYSSMICTQIVDNT